MSAPDIYVFGPFRLDTSRRSLERNGQALALSGRAFDILHILLSASDRVVSREEIMAKVWPGLVVEPSNLTVQVSALRRVLGDTGDEPLFIATVTGRGYKFIGSVAAVKSEPAVRRQSAPMPRRAALLIAGFLLVLFGAGALIFRHAPRTPPVPRLSLVVMPFRNLSTDRSRDYLADAVTDDLTTDLARIPGSLVISRETADSLKSRVLTAEAIGRMLKVRYLLEGSLRADGDQLRINAQLIDTETGAHVWAERFDTTSKNLMDTQTDLVRRLANTLDVALVDAAARTIPPGLPRMADSRDLFLRARSVIHHAQTLTEISQAQSMLEQAIDADPDNADALAALGWLLVRKEQSFDYPSAAADDAEAERVIARAFRLAPENPAVLAARGRFLASSGHCAEATAAFDAALARDPNNILALTGVALCAWRTGDLASVVPAMEKTLRVDPEGPAANLRYHTMGLAELFAGHPDQAIAYLLRAEAQEPENPTETNTAGPAEITRLFLMAAYGMSGDIDEARRRYRAYAASWPGRSIWRVRTLLTPAQTSVAAYPRIEAALHEAGMPRFADEHADFGVAASSTALAGGEFTPTPQKILGGTVADTRQVQSLLAHIPAPIVIDVSLSRAAVMPGALTPDDGELAQDRALLDGTPLGKQLQSAPLIIVAGTGVLGTDGYNGALRLIALGYRQILWYRGGEEAWAAAGLPWRDLRGP